MRRARTFPPLLLLLVARPLLAQDAAVFPLDTVRVDVVSRTDAAFLQRTRAVEVLTGAQLAALPARTVAEALAWALAADVQPRSGAQADLSLRGSTFEQVLVLVDGVRVSDAQTGHFDLDLTVPLERVERIEILRGPASALYGSDAMGGVVNIVTRSGGRSASARVERGSFDRWAASASGDAQVDAVQAFASGEWARSDGHRPGTDHDALLVHGGLRTSLAAGRLALDAGHARRDFGADGFYGAYPSYEETRATTVSLGWSGALAEGLTVEPRLSARWHEDDFVLIRESPSTYENVHRASQRGGELTVRWQADDGLRLAAGGELFRDDIDSRNVATGRPALGERDETRSAGFGELAWGGARAALTGGARYDRHEGFGGRVSPSVSGSFDVSERVRVRGSWGRSFRAPTWTERYYQDPASQGDPELDPERSWTLDAGGDLRLPGGATLRATGWVRRAEDLIDWARPAGSAPTTPSRVMNVESATFRGVEVELGGLRAAGLEIALAGSLLGLDAEEAEGLVSRYALRPVQERAVATVSRSLLAGRLLVAGHLLHERRTGDPSYRLLGARAALKVPGGTLELTGSNLTDAEHADILTVTTGAPAPGRALRLAYRVTWGDAR